jgi:hypothetical protein
VFIRLPRDLREFAAVAAADFDYKKVLAIREACSAVKMPVTDRARFSTALTTRTCSAMMWSLYRARQTLRERLAHWLK